MRPRSCGLVLTFVFALILSGCGPTEPPGGTVSGRVTIGDKVLPVGTITFTSEDFKRTVVGSINPDGTYTVKGVALGKNKVTVTAPQPPEEDAPKPLIQAKGGYAPVPIPEKYENVATTDLVVEVSKGPNPPYNPRLKVED
jgi:hypothetical protein